MKQIGRKYHKSLAALIIILALSGAVILVYVSGILDYVEYKLYDFRINLFSSEKLLGMDNPFKYSHPRSSDIVLVLLDQASLDWGQRERGWGWPWPRAAYAEFVEYMNLSGAESVAFDVHFSEPSIYRNPKQDEIIERALRNTEMAEVETGAGGGAARRELLADRSIFRDIIRDIRSLGERVDDASFAEASKNYGRVVQAVLFRSQSGSADVWPTGLNVPVFRTENFDDSFFSEFAFGKEKNVMNGGQFPIKELSDTAGIIGSVTGISDSDDIFRSQRLFTVFDGKAVPSLAAASLLVSGEEETIFYNPARKNIRWGNYTIPVDREGKTLLRFKGELDRYFHYGMSEVLQSAEDYAAGKDPLCPPDIFEGRYVFFGFFAPGLFDTFSTPVNSVYPGLGVHVTMLDNLLMGDYIKKAPDWIPELLISALIILMVVLVLFTSRISISVTSLIASVAAVIVAGLWTFSSGYWFPIAAPVLALLLAYMASTLYNYATEGKDKRFLKQAFSRVISPKLVEQLIIDPSQLKLGGERRKMTAIFTDIQRFSSISSELQEQYGEDGPKVLVNLLNLYLTEMSNLVIANGGTVDKYEGDAIIAFFGAPIWMEDHAVRACRSAIQMKKQEMVLVERIMNPEGEFYKPLKNLIESKAIRKERPLYTRLGINTGDMVVGFMGTPGKMDYTIMGNAVNLAARLEGVNKQYDTRGILISEYTREFIGDEFVIRPLSRVTVVGIPVPLRLYELLEIRSDATPELLNLVKYWEHAIKIFEAKNFPEAKKYFAEIYRKDSEDSTAKHYLERCEKYLTSPPPSDWDGVDNLTEK